MTQEQISTGFQRLIHELALTSDLEKRRLLVAQANELLHAKRKLLSKTTKGDGHDHRR